MICDSFTMEKKEYIRAGDLLIPRDDVSHADMDCAKHRDAACIFVKGDDGNLKRYVFYDGDARVFRQFWGYRKKGQ